MGQVVFLYKLVEGIAPASYGIHVARLAQLPDSVLHRAAEIAAQVQEENERMQRRLADEQAVRLAAACLRLLQGALKADGAVNLESVRKLQEQARHLMSS
jgi:DNA mismatch repair ATPase MutS